jgi:hypothetical protein
VIWALLTGCGGHGLPACSTGQVGPAVTVPYNPVPLGGGDGAVVVGAGTVVVGCGSVVVGDGVVGGAVAGGTTTVAPGPTVPDPVVADGPVAPAPAPMVVVVWEGDGIGAIEPGGPEAPVVAGRDPTIDGADLSARPDGDCPHPATATTTPTMAHRPARTSSRVRRRLHC